MRIPLKFIVFHLLLFTFSNGISQDLIGLWEGLKNPKENMQFHFMDEKNVSVFFPKSDSWIKTTYTVNDKILTIFFEDDSKLQFTYVIKDGLLGLKHNGSIIPMRKTIGTELIGEWIEKNDHEIKITFEFIDFENVNLMMDGKQYSGNYIVNSDEIHMGVANVDFVYKYSFKEDLLLLSIEGQLHTFEKVKKINEHTKTNTEKKSLSDKVCSRTFSGSHITEVKIPRNTKCNIIFEEKELLIDNLILEENAELVLPGDQYYLKLNIKNFISKKGSKITAKGSNGRNPNFEALLKNQHKVKMNQIRRSGSECANGTDGDLGYKGYDGGNGCKLNINANHINIQGLTINLSGGYGEKGERGGDGGNGGMASCTCGNGGNGGNAGSGGNGGNGGNGGDFELVFKSGFGEQNIVIYNKGGKGGMKGLKGSPGIGGSATYSCINQYPTTYKGRGGNPAYSARPGSDGIGGKIRINKRLD